MSVFLTHEQARALEYKMNFKKGKSYKCIKGYYINGPNKFTSGKIYTCKNNYYLPCDSGIEISQFNLIGIDNMFSEE